MKKLLFLCLLISGQAFGITQYGVQPLIVGAEGGGAATFVGISPNTNNCLYGGVYFANPFDPKVALSVAMAAKASGKTLRVDYSIAGNGQCMGMAIYVE